jgi:iron complex transport system substrate-binding protein
MRIVSLQPGCAEIVCALGCAERLVGRSRECDFPAEILSVPICAAAQMRELRPDIILTHDQGEPGAASLAELEKALPAAPSRRPKIISIAPLRLAGVWADMQRIADALGVSEEGRAVLWRLKNRVVDIIQHTCLLRKRPSVACLEWLDPLMAAGRWVPEMVELAGGHDALGAPGRPSARLEWEKLAQADPDMIVLMPRGLGLERARGAAAALDSRPEWRNLRAVKSRNVFITDGNHYFHRPGPRAVESIEILAEMLHPKLFAFGHETRNWARL